MLHYGSGNLDKIQTGPNPGLNFKASDCGGQEEEQEKLTFKPDNKSNSEAFGLKKMQQSNFLYKCFFYFILPLYFHSYLVYKY